MYCIKCWNENTKVVDSRVSDDGKSIRRRRECENCNYRFTTFEKIELLNFVVVKSWDRRQKYNKEKLEDSILKAVNKRDLWAWVIKNLIRVLESKWMSKDEITSKKIWKDVLAELAGIDEVAYIRYASVNLNFETAKDFTEFITEKFNKK